MNTRLILIAALFSCTIMSFAQQEKHLESWAAVTAVDAIRLEGFNGTDLVVRTWDEPKAEIRLDISIETSSETTENEYIRDVRIEQDHSSEGVVFRLEQPSVNVGFSLRNLLSLRFNTFVKKEIRGEIFLPKENAFIAEVKYGKLDIEGLDGPVELESRSSLIDVRSCAQLESIQNNYGTTSIEDCGGDLSLENRSGRIDIVSHSGRLNITAKYSTISARSVSDMVEVISQSGSVTLKDVGGDAVIDAPYSNITVEDGKGSATINGKSGAIRISRVHGLEVEAPYSTIDAQDIAGVEGHNVHIRGQSGKISLSAVTSGVEIQSPYTNIDLSEIAGDVFLSTKSGNVRAHHINGNWRSQTQYSRLTLTDMSAKEVRIENKSGAVDLDMTTMPSTVHILNEYADINVQMPKGIDAQIRLKSEYGSISSDLPVETEKMGGSMLALGRAGNGSGSFTAQTKSGNIRIREK